MTTNLRTTKEDVAFFISYCIIDPIYSRFNKYMLFNVIFFQESPWPSSSSNPALRSWKYTFIHLTFKKHLRSFHTNLSPPGLCRKRFHGNQSLKMQSKFENAPKLEHQERAHSFSCRIEIESEEKNTWRIQRPFVKASQGLIPPIPPEGPKSEASQGEMQLKVRQPVSASTIWND